MKKVLFIFLLFPIIGFGQSCQYGSSTDASELCNFYQGQSFATYRNADIALDKILNVTGMSKRFVLKECNNISNCMATSYKGIRYILYDKYFMDAIATRTDSWSKLSILAHEVGHHVNGHSLDLILVATETVDAPKLSESRKRELEADEYSGFVMYKLGASLYQAQEAIRLLSSNADDTYSTHPSRDKRLKAIEKGYNKAKSQGVNTNNSNNNITLTAEDYFYKAYNSSDPQYQIDDYSRAIRINPDYANAYYNRGVVYYDLGKDQLALDDYSRAIRINPDFADAYYNRGVVYGNLGKYQLAIDDYSRAIRINPDYADAYYNRGLSYYKLGKYQPAIDDYSRAIRINPDIADAYNGRGTAKWSLKLEFCSDFKRVCELGNCDNYNNFCK